MKKVFLITGIVLLLALTFGYQTGRTENQILEKKPVIAGQRYVPGEIIVKFKPGVDQSIITNINSMNNAVAFYTSRAAGFKRLKIPHGRSVSEMVGRYRKNPRVEYAEPNYILSAHWVPDDPYYSDQWHLDNPDYGGINMEAAWGISTGSGVKVAVIDTGVAYEDYDGFLQAPDLANTSFVAGYDFVNGDPHPNDDDGHGTHVTGTIAQSTHNGIGVAGVAYNCSIMPIKVLDNFGEGTYANVADGIYFAANNGAQVINMSLGGGYDSETLEEAVAYAYGKGVTIVASSGNDGVDSLDYPAAYDAYVIAVGATRYDEAIAYYSNYGVGLDIVAPGGDLTADQNGDGYGDGVLQQTFGYGDPTDFGYWFYHGTSMASPHVAGVAALVIANGVTGPDAVREVLQSTADDLGPNGWDETYGWGLLNAAAALTAEPDEELPSTPTDLSTTPVSGSQVDLTWTESTDNVGVTGYNIYRDGVQVGTAETTGYSDTALQPNTTYSYYVEAYDAAGNESGSSDTASATTLDQVTGQGFMLSKNSDFSTENREFATSDTLYIKIYSEFVDFNDLRKKEYKVEDVNRKRMNGNLTNHFDGIYTASVSLLSLTPGAGKVSIKIEDNDRTKYEVKDERITIIEASDEEPPTKPTNLVAAAASENQIDLNWDASTDNIGVAGYSIFRDGGLFGTSATTSFSDTGLEPSTTYEYKVQAFDAAGNESSLSDPASATTPDQETGQGFILSKNSDFSTDDRVFSKTDTLYIKIYSDVVDFNNIKKKEYKVEDINRKKIKGNLTNHLDGTYTVSVSLSSLVPGTGKVNIKIEDNSRKKYEVKNELITIIE
ncbi:MAG: S8 family serine peptidase [Candidatus Aminicenantes bacterium]|nr:S8 family serine peptidase [Candidatus Aminicenantes bacterium]